MMASSSPQNWKSALYRGTVQHRRLRPKPHQFQYSMFMLYLDLDELPELFDQSRWYSARSWALARFRRKDHLGDPGLPLSHCVRDLVEQQSGKRPRGPIRLLTQLRYFGYGFNPVSFYYCFDQDDTRLESVVAEVNNTPWGEQHCYVLDADSELGRGGVHAGAKASTKAGAKAGIYHWQQSKRMHVSPFMPMDMRYDFRLSEPGEMLTIYMQNHRDGALVFDAGLQLQRHPINAASLRNALWQYPAMSLQVICAIHWQALRLWLKGMPVFTHPSAS